MASRAILLGSKPGAVAALMILLDRGWDVVEVVASPEQADWIPANSLNDVASGLGIRTVTRQDELRSAGVDLVISYMCRSLVKRKTLERGRYALNFHAGPLPEFGGWAFYNVAILEGSREYGCTCHIMDDGFDTGPLVQVRRFEINPEFETAVSLEKKAQAEMILMFKEVISDYDQSGEINSTPQDPNKMRYMTAEEFAALKEIPPGASPEQADRIARAFWYPPYSIAYVTMQNGTKVEVVPRIVKEELAAKLHEDDLEVLLRVADLPGGGMRPKDLTEPVPSSRDVETKIARGDELLM